MTTVFGLFPLMRNIVIRERINIVHGHQAFSAMYACMHAYNLCMRIPASFAVAGRCHEMIFHARTLGLKACFTDHSLFGFADPSSIITNKLLEFTLSGVNHVICVSHTSKENTVLRASLAADCVSVIPNAVDTSKFVPNSAAVDANYECTIVIVTRLVYRKGVDLLVDIIPAVCARFPKVIRHRKRSSHQHTFLVCAHARTHVCVHSCKSMHAHTSRLAHTCAHTSMNA